MKSILTKYFVFLLAGAFVLGLAACKQAEEPADVEVEEVEVQENAPAATEMTDSMAEPTVQQSAQEMGGTEVEVEETVEETVDTVEDMASPSPSGTTDDTGGDAQ